MDLPRRRPTKLARTFASNDFLSKDLPIVTIWENSMPDANWFAAHPAFTIIGHTILVAGVTWAASRFIFNESKLNWYRAIIENKDTQINNLTERLSFVEKENEKYLRWLNSDSQTFPSMANRIRELEQPTRRLRRRSSLLQSMQFL